MSTVLGLIGIAVFIGCVVALAAGVTWLVVRVSPDPNRKKKAAETAKPAETAN